MPAPYFDCLKSVPEFFETECKESLAARSEALCRPDSFGIPYLSPFAISLLSILLNGERKTTFKI